MLRLISSNSIEQLATALATELRQSFPDNPLQAQQVLISTNAMSRWLALALSEHLGICAGVDFDFGGRALRHLVLELDGSLSHPADDPWDPSRLRWSVAALLEAMPSSATWQPLLQLWNRPDAETSGLDRYRLRLLIQICDTLDQYALYRPRMVRRWLAGEDCDASGAPLPEQDRWQPALLRALQDRLAPQGVAHPAERLLGALEAASQLTPQAQPLHVFGLSSLPPAMWQLLAQQAGSGARPVIIYQLSPSLDPWGEEPVNAQAESALESLEQRLLYRGHPLLASLGRTQRDFHWQLELIAAELQERFCREPLPPEPPAAGDGLLQQLKRDMHLGLRRAEGMPGLEPPLSIEAEQVNLLVLACHGDRRQVEEAHNTVLALMAADPALEPRHVLLMTSDVARFTPLVQAVFERPGGSADPRHLPVRVTDRTLRQRNPRVDLVFRLLDLVGGRLDCEEVLDLLMLPEVAAHLELHGLSQPQWRSLLQAAGIRWGRDAQHRVRWGYPDDAQHSWRWGLDRLLLGLQLEDAFPENDADAGQWQSIAACHGPLATAEVVLALNDACGRLFEQLQQLEAPQTPDAWNRNLAQAVQQLGGSGNDDGWQSPELYALLEPLRLAGDQKLELDSAAVVTLLEEAEAQEQGRYGHVSGAVTLSALEPMRSIPHRIVVLLGMDEERLPRRDTRAGFDLMLRQRWRGDRDRRQEDRAILMEALQACTQHWIATFTAIDPRSGEERNPAAPLSDLLRCLESSYRTPAGEPITTLVVQQRQPLPPLPRAVQQVTAPWPPSLQWPLPEIAQAGLEELQHWLRDPHRALLRAHDIRPLRRARREEDPEETDADGLSRWNLTQRLLSLGSERLQESSWPAQQEALAMRAQLPPGPAAQLASADSLQRSRLLLQRSLDLGDEESSVVLICSGRFNPKRLLDGWLDHLWANAEAPRTTHLVGLVNSRDGDAAGSWQLLPIAQEIAQERLADLQQLRCKGLQQPISFVPELNWIKLSRQQAECGDSPLPGLTARQLSELNPESREGYRWPEALLQLEAGESPDLDRWLQQPEVWELSERVLLPLSEALAAGGFTP